MVFQHNLGKFAQDSTHDMISKNKIKYIHLLEQKKYRNKEKVFVAEGHKVVEELLVHYKPVTVIATEKWLHGRTLPADTELILVSEDELQRVSLLQHPQQVLAVFPQMDERTFCPEDVDTDKLSVALDGVQDPGNLGTIIRIADWFGITDIYCSPDTADVYNPKVVQATMGSIARVRVTYGDLCALVEALPHSFPVYGTMLDGDNIYDSPLQNQGIVVMGNEGKGISPALAAKVNRRLLIPNYPPDRETAESLNVAIATAITCAEFRRQAR